MNNLPTLFTLLLLVATVFFTTLLINSKLTPQSTAKTLINIGSILLAFVFLVLSVVSVRVYMRHHPPPPAKIEQDCCAHPDNTTQDTLLKKDSTKAN